MQGGTGSARQAGSIGSPSWAGSWCRLAVSMESGAPQPEAQCMPMDQPDGLVCHEWMSDQHPDDHPVGQAPASEIQAGVEQESVAGVLVDGDPQACRLVPDPDRVAAGDLDERRHVEVL